MRALDTQPVLTDTFDERRSFHPHSACAYVYAKGVEDRGRHVDEWRSARADITFIEVTDEDLNSIAVSGIADRVFLRDSGSISRLWASQASSSTIYLDITGLTHSAWAALLRSALSTRRVVSVVYVEPFDYSRSSNPVDSQIYDLSDRIDGIAPLPGFAVLSDSSIDSVFIPLLGFEGTRLRYLLEQTQPAADRIFPIVGLPGFKSWYVFDTFLGNRPSLIEKNAWQAVKFAPGDCPFRCFYALEDLASEFPQSVLKIAPIGTKPHALGAVLFALSSAMAIELIYDHPKRKAGRTEGFGKLHVYHVSALISNPSPPRINMGRRQ